MKITSIPTCNFFLLMAIMALNLSACNRQSSFDDLHAKLSMIKNASENDSKKFAIAEVSIPTPVEYGQSNASSNNPSGNKNLDPLQAFPVTQLKFIGTVTQENELQAYIATPDGRIFPVKKGDKIGDHYGKITHIDSKKIEVAQNEMNERKKLVEKIIVIQATE